MEIYKPKKDLVSKMVNDLDSVMDMANKMSASYADNYEKRCFFSNIAGDLHNMAEKLDEFNMNNSQ